MPTTKSTNKDKQSDEKSEKKVRDLSPKKDPKAGRSGKQGDLRFNPQPDPPG